MTIVEVFVPNAYFSVTASMTPQQKMLRWRRCERLFEPFLRGCSSVVEHLLAKEDVASSSLVTRSNFIADMCGRTVCEMRFNIGCNRLCRPDCRSRPKLHHSSRKSLPLTRSRSWRNWNASFVLGAMKRCARGKI